MRALIIGATGATGKDLVNVLLDSADYTEIVAFVRKPLNIEHPKLSFVVTNFNKLEEVSSKIKGDILFSCLGTSLKAAGSKERQWNIDFQMPARFAAIARLNGVPGVVLLSAYGASVKSPFFYSKIKGELESYICHLVFTRYIIFRPGLLLRKDTDRFGEKMSSQMLMFLNKFGLMRKFKPLPTALLAEKLAKAPLIRSKGVHVIELENIWRL